MVSFRRDLLKVQVDVTEERKRDGVVGNAVDLNFKICWSPKAQLFDKERKMWCRGGVGNLSWFIVVLSEHLPLKPQQAAIVQHKALLYLF